MILREDVPQYRLVGRLAEGGLTVSSLARQLLREWYSEYMDRRLLETLVNPGERIVFTPESLESPEVRPSDPGYPGAYPLPDSPDAMSPTTELSDADWLEQNRRINHLLMRPKHKRSPKPSPLAKRHREPAAEFGM